MSIVAMIKREKKWLKIIKSMSKHPRKNPPAFKQKERDTAIGIKCETLADLLLSFPPPLMEAKE